MKGFFSASKVATKAPESLVPKCGACGLYKKCKSPKMMPWGRMPTTTGGILVVNEHITKSDDALGKQPTGEAKTFLEKKFSKLGINPAEVVYTSATACYSKEKIDSEKINHCRPKLRQTIKDLRPRLIIPMGWEAVYGVIPLAWKKSPEGEIETWIGWQIPSIELDAWICPMHSPEYLDGRAPDEIPELLYDKHLKAALALQDRPRRHNVPTASCVQRVLDTKLAAKMLRRIPENVPIAFDYETNMLKPDGKRAQIVSCAVAWSEHMCVAFPWEGDVIPAMSKLLRSPRPKIAANLKFEERWTRKILGHGVRNWVWDTMQTAHVLDNRRMITGLKFQALVQLGEPDYSSHIEEFLRAEGGNKPNRIKEIDIMDLLLYNGMDSILELRLALLQRKEIRNENVG